MDHPGRERDLPEEVGHNLEQLCEELAASLGDRLEAIVLYGGLARGEYNPPSSDVNLLVVVREADVDTLDRMAEPLRDAALRIPLSLMVATEADLDRSTDIFPTRFLEMQRHHRILHGRDVLAGLEIGRDHLRLRCEQEIKNLLLRLRQFYVQRAARAELLEQTLSGAVASFLADLAVLLELKTGLPPLTKEAIAAAAGRELGVPAGPVREALALKRGEARPDLSELKALYGRFMSAVETAALVADKM